MAALFAGGLVYLILVAFLMPSTALIILGVVAAAPTAVSKTATACGINVLHSFSRYEQPMLLRLGSACIYVLVSTVTAAVIGLALSGLGSWLHADGILLLAAPVALAAGARELDGRARPVPTLTWQVPARWVRNPRIAPIVWGVFLGSGVATWMPRASFYVVLLLAILLPFPAGPVLLGAYGLFRSIPGLAAALTSRCSGSALQTKFLRLVLTTRMASGVASLVLAGGLVVHLIRMVSR